MKYLKKYLLSASSTGTTKIIVLDFTYLEKKEQQQQQQQPPKKNSQKKPPNPKPTNTTPTLNLLGQTKMVLTIFSDLSLSWQTKLSNKPAVVKNKAMYLMQSGSELSFVIPVDSWGMLQHFEYFVFLSRHWKNVQDCSFTDNIFFISEYTELDLIAFLFPFFPRNFSFLALGIPNISSVKHFLYKK